MSAILESQSRFLAIWASHSDTATASADTAQTRRDRNDAWDELGTELASRYRQAHRHYHNLDHVLAVIDALEALGSATAANCLAGFFHDAVYEPTRSDNEAASAELAIDRLGAIACERRLVDRVAQVVAATAFHLAHEGPTVLGQETQAREPDLELLAFLDADLSVLASDKPTYDRYTAGIRREYVHLSSAEFVAGRMTVVRTLLERTPLFFGHRAQTLWQQSAINNLRRELEMLQTF